MTFFLKFLRGKLGAIVLYVAMMGIFFLSFAFYALPMEAVAYPAVLCTVCAVVVLVRDWVRAVQKHRRFSAISSFTQFHSDALPPVQDATQEDLLAIIRALCAEEEAFRTDTQKRYTDMVDYYSIWVHQIKTPIASMRLTLQNEDSPLSRKLQSDLFRVEQYVEMVLMFLRLSSETTDYVLAECDLDAIVRQAVKKYAGEFIGRKLQLDYMPLNVRVLTDEKWLAFVIEQVLSNALKYTREGCITISLEAPKTLCIRDTGMGIAPEDLPRIFEKGYTGYRGRVDKTASGIGLYLCRRICTNLGHSITASSTPDVGTVIRIDLARNALEVE